MKTNFSLLFYLKRPKNYTKGPAPIYLRVTVNGNPKEISTGRDCEPELWNSKAGHMKGTKEEVKTLNAYLDNMKAEVAACYRLLCLKEEEVTAERVKAKYLGIEGTETPYTINEAIAEHNSDMEALVGQDYKIGTLKRFQVLQRHIKAFLMHEFKLENIDIKKVDRAFIGKFDFYLRKEKKNANNTAVKHLKNFKKIILVCLGNKLMDDNPFVGYKMKSRETKKIFLTAHELQLIASKAFTTDRLNQVRDFFLFSCYTGLSYIDVKRMVPSDINIGVDGGLWITKFRQKTDNRLAIPLLPVTEAIINRYKNHPVCINGNRVLPVSSNQKMNEYLVEVAELAGVKKKLGNRVAKRTFATTVTLANGVPIESVSKMLGHNSLRTTQLYAQLLDTKVAKDMAPIKDLFAVENTGTTVNAADLGKSILCLLDLIQSDATNEEIIAQVSTLKESLKLAV